MRWWNVRTPERYLAAIESGRSAEGGREELTADQREFEALTLALRTRRGVPWACLERPEELGGLVVDHDGRAVLTVRGPPAGQRGQRQNPLRYPAPMTETSRGAAPADDLMEKVVRLCRHRGFIFPSAEIYGGFRSTYDYGPLGVNMLRNVKNAWWRAMVQERDDVVGLDAAILGPPAVWAASGHLATFTDPLVDCKNCHERWRADKIDGVCPNCGSHDLTEARAFNLMFKTHAGPVEDEGHVAYLRPETAQGMFTNFANVLGTTRKKPPFGIAQVGKSFRNEITPQNFVFRTREFEQMELEYFVPPDQAPQVVRLLAPERMQWYLDLGIPAEQLRLRHHEASELSHYSRATADVEFHFPWGFDELEGIANRGDFDLTAHAKASGEKLDYFDPQTNERYTPYVIEPAAGATRTMMAFLLSAYDEDEVGGESRTVLRLHWRLAPYQVAVLPLSKKDTLEPLARQVLKTAPAPLHVRLRRHPGHRQALPAPGRGGHAVVRHRRLRLARGRRGHRPRPRHHRAGACPHCGLADRAAPTHRRGLIPGSLRRPCGTCAPPGAPRSPASPKHQASACQIAFVSVNAPPVMSERAASTTWVTGWCLAKAWSQPGMSCTGTKAELAKVSGKRMGKTMSCAVSALGAESPTVAKAQHRE